MGHDLANSSSRANDRGNLAQEKSDRSAAVQKGGTRPKR